MKKLLSALLSFCFIVVACISPFDAFAKDIYSNNDIDHAVVHDPSIFKDRDGTYYIVGSHLVMYKSKDLINWENTGSSIDGDNFLCANGRDWKENLAEPLAWTSGYQLANPQIYNPDNLEYNCWANDLIFNENMGKYCLYGACSVWGTTASVIWLATADKVEGPYEYVSSLVYTGITNDLDPNSDDKSRYAMNYTNTNMMYLIEKGYIDEEKDLNTYVAKSKPEDPDEYKYFTADHYYKCWFGQYPNAIDPTPFVDKNGDMWMVYGSYSGGCYLIKLDNSTGLPDYDYMSSRSDFDNYFGKLISSTNFDNEGTGEGPYIVYDKVSDYYYFFLTYGGLGGEGGYNIRVYRSKSPTGPYTDAKRKSATDWDNTGVKLDAGYKFSSMASANISGGHSSCLVDDDGSIYQVYHTRFTADGGNGFKTVIHQMARTSNGWVTMLPYEYQGEKVSNDTYTKNDIVGKYELVNSTNMTQRKATWESPFSDIVVPTQYITLNSDGTITGAKEYGYSITSTNTGCRDVKGSWKLTNGKYLAEFKIGTVTYSGAFAMQKDESENATPVMTFTGVGTDNSTIWGVRHTIHSYSDVTTKATVTKDGRIDTKCGACGDIKATKSICYPKTINLSATSYTYDGKAKKPAVTIKDSAGKTTAASNYSVTYSNNKNVGKASAKITFKGNYSGTKTLTFKINPKATTLSSVTVASKGFTVKWKKQATQTTGYEIQYSSDKNFKNGNKTVTVSKNSTTSKKVTKLKAKKKYYVRIRTYKTVSGTKYYSAWSKAKTVTTKK